MLSRGSRGDEFVALARYHDRDRMLNFVARLDAALKAPLSLGSSSGRAGASIGVAIFPNDADHAEAAYQQRRPRNVPRQA